MASNDSSTSRKGWLPRLSLRRLRPSPLVQMTMTLVSLCGMILVLADIFLGVFPDRHQQLQRERLQLGEGLAVQMAALLKASEVKAVQTTMNEAAGRMPGLRSAGLRRADGELILQSPEHQRTWALSAPGAAAPEDRVEVPMNADGKRWGQLELAFVPLHKVWWQRWTQEPMLLTLLFIGPMGSLVFGLYMRRALQHLDPSQVIPERVQGAFDAMSEGVVVLDGRARMLLCNKAFKALNGWAAQIQPGQNLSQLSWLASGMTTQEDQHPWAQAMSSRSPVAGLTVEIAGAEIGGAAGKAGPPPTAGNKPTQHLVINAAPIRDAGGRVRGCLVTFSDMTALHHANVDLKRTLGERDAAYLEIEKKNEELHRLATRDPMTGAYNRRAFTESFANLFKTAIEAQQPLNCLVLDIDFFKKVNDTHGHTIGDRVIQEVARLLQAHARPVDIVCRYGGEEFVVVLPGLTLTEANAVAERIREAIQRDCGPSVKEVPGMKVTMSIGLAALEQGAKTPAELIDHADHALYVAKKTGRNRVCVHGVDQTEVAESLAV
jgi:diguanylate cyclase (GGDEF)-like protein